MTILYEVHNGLYVNMTNKCPCRCTFCLRQQKGSRSLYGDLWLDREPTVTEVKDEFLKRDLSKYDEIVFCGFGEPTERLYDILEICDFLRTLTDLPIRINTNGMADLIHNKSTAADFKGRIDTVSISLNTPDKKRYYELTRNKFGEDAFDAIISFAREVKPFVKKVVLSTVETTITREQEKECKAIADAVGAEYRIRPYEDYSDSAE